MNPHEEAYVHFQDCLSSLNRAWQIVQAIAANAPTPILTPAAYRMALVEYAKPFKTSYGAGRRRLNLSIPRLQEGDLQLHSHLLALRDQTLAHSDLSLMEAKVYIHELAGKPFPLIISNTEPQLPEIAKVQGLIERVLDSLYSQIPAYEAQLQQPI